MPQAEHSAVSSATVDDKGPTIGLAVGARYGLFAAELGVLTLPGYHADATGENPHRHATQDITGRALFARGMVIAPDAWRLQPYGFLGAAKVNGENHEVGQCAECGAGYVPDWHSSTSKVVPYYGGGLQIRVSEHWSARGELGILPKAIVSPWTGTRTYAISSISVLYTF